MIYVMECGPVVLERRRHWVVFSLDSSTRKVMTRVAPVREHARKAVADELGRAPATCCASLGEFGRERGWQVRPVPEDVLALAGVTLVGLEHQDLLGPQAVSPQTEALLRACAMFLDTAPWLQFSSYEPLAVTFTADPPITRVLAVAGSGRLPPGLIMVEGEAAFWRAHSRSDPVLDDAVIVSLPAPPDVISDTLELAFGEAFHPRLLRLRGGKPVPMSGQDLAHLTAALAATASLATGRPAGRAVAGELEAIVVPCAGPEEPAVPTSSRP